MNADEKITALRNARNRVARVKPWAHVGSKTKGARRFVALAGALNRRIRVCSARKAQHALYNEFASY